MKTIWFDLDGCIAGLYAVENWLDYLQNESTYPYEAAKPLLNFSMFAKLLRKLQNHGYKIGIISWTSKSGSEEYHNRVEYAKRQWLARHLPSVVWDEIRIVRYGTNKYLSCGGGILFDDEERNRDSWEDESYSPEDIIRILKSLLEEV